MNKRKLKENIKKILFFIRTILVIIITLGLFATFKSVKSPIQFLVILILIHLLILAIAHILENGVFKKQGKIKEYLINVIQVSLTGVGLHIVSIVSLVIVLSSLTIITEIVALFGFICSAILLQKISFFKII